MSLINDYTYMAMNDQRERELAQLAESNWQVRQALNRRAELVAQVAGPSRQRSSTTAQHPAQRGMATPQHRVAH